MMEQMNNTGHIVVGGFGHLGSRIAEHLRQENLKVVLIEKEVHESDKHRAAELGYCLIEGDIADDIILQQADIADARCFIAATGDDRANLEAGLIVRQRLPGLRIILRLFDDMLARQAESTFGLEALSASFIASPAFVAAATDESIISAFNIDGQHLCFYKGPENTAHHKQGLYIAEEQGRLSASAEAQGEPRLFVCCQSAKELTEAQSRQRKGTRRHAGIGLALKALNPLLLLKLVLDIWRHSIQITRSLLKALFASIIISVVIFAVWGGLSPLDALYFVVTTMTTVGYGDFNLQTAPPLLKLYGILMMLSGAALLATAYAIISDYVLSTRLEYLLGRRAVNKMGHTIVVGLGKVGFQVAADLHILGMDLVAIEAKEDSDNISAARLLFSIIIGNAGRSSVLQKAGLASARTILALTDDPMLNLSVALHARACNPQIKTIIRIYEPNFAERLRGLNFDAVISTSAIAAPVFVDTALIPGVEGSFEYGGQNFLVIKQMINGQSPFAGKTAQQISAESGIAALFAASDENSDSYQRVAPETAIAVGQKVILLATRGNMPKP
jgi:Trk K+ transport system NAD-binding subunit